MPKNPKLIFTNDLSDYLAKATPQGDIKVSKLFEDAPAYVKGAVYQHEVGHISLGHIGQKKSQLSAAQKLSMEFEADVFAREKGSDIVGALKYALGTQASPHGADMIKQRLVHQSKMFPKKIAETTAPVLKKSAGILTKRNALIAGGVVGGMGVLTSLLSDKEKFNPIDGLHPGSEGLGAEMVRKHSEFGSGYQGMTLLEQDVEDVMVSSNASHLMASNRTELLMNMFDVYGGVRNQRERRAGQALQTLRNRNGQKFAGMGNEGTFGAQMRRRITDFKAEFASRWDKWSNMAMKLADSTEDLAFRKARREAVQVGERAIGEGMSGAAYLMKGSYKGEEFKFIRKMGDFGENEVSAQIAARADAPSVYGWGKGEAGKYMDMEYFSGKELGSMQAEEIASLSSQINKTLESVHKTGYTHGDTHLGNLFVIENAGKKEVGIIDFGKAAKSQAQGIEKDFRMAREGVERASSRSPLDEGIQHVTQAIDPFAAASQGPTLAQLDPFSAPENQSSLAGTVMQLGKVKPEDAHQHAQNLATKQAVRRNRKFAKASENAVGIGLRSANKAGKGHTRYGSTMSK